MSIILYFKYRPEKNEGLCNQLMAIFRIIGETLYHSKQGNNVGIILNDFQTRLSSDTVDFNTNFSKISFDSFVDVNKLIQLLSKENILVRRPEEIDNTNQQNVVFCNRFPIRSMTQVESKETGLFIANNFPFAKKVVNIASCIVNLMSPHTKWKAIHLRIEDELKNFQEDPNADFENHINNQISQTLNMISAPDLSGVYLATGIKEGKYNKIVQMITKKLPHLFVANKMSILKDQPKLLNELNTLSLEEQALVDWLVCLGSPYFAGPHGYSFAYLAGYMRHYRGLDKESTQLWPGYQPLWDLWFPRI
ncbi:hypothetical protein [Peribacillus simplex]|uniref:hypothetical protein n=1 Tax=Peribacillus simplex TaxID=1478 RepID=UPI00285302F1|nr:hypothetical protein [Peribacillus simplex]MDR4926172.1 hypothetical protein [Peribacillus simplex]